MLKPVTLLRLKQQGIPVNASLPGVVSTQVRPVKEIAMRAVVLGVFIAIANDPKSVGYFNDLLSEMKMTEALSDHEKAILKKGKLTAQQEIDLSWSQESLYAISWCLGIFPQMNAATGEADLKQMFPGLPPEVELEQFLATAKLIDTQLIIEELEYYYGLHWAVRHPESWSWLNRYKCKKYNMSVIRERRRALEWINNAQLSWDDIPLNT